MNSRFVSYLRSSSDLGLLGSPDLLHPVLPSLLLFSRSLLSWLQHSLSPKPELGLELLGKVHRVVDEGKAGRLAATEVRLEAEGEHAIGGALVHLGQLLPDLGLGHGGPVGVEDVDNHLATSQQLVGHVLASTNGNRAFTL